MSGDCCGVAAVSPEDESDSEDTLPSEDSDEEPFFSPALDPSTGLPKHSFFGQIDDDKVVPETPRRFERCEIVLVYQN